MSETGSDRRQKAAMVSRLLSHFWTADDHPEMRAGQIEDWLTDLGGYSLDVLAEACARWRIAESRRPTIADIHKLCVAVQQEEREKRERLEGPAVADLREARARAKAAEERRHERNAAEGREIADRWAQARGFADLEAYAAAEGISYGEACFRVILGNNAAAPAASGFRSLGAAMGVKAREYTPEEMARSRREMGIDDMQEAAE